MFEKTFSKFQTQMGIDLGTSNTRLFVKGKGIVVNEPSVVAINNRNSQILAVGQEAKEMIGKTPPNVATTKPLLKGIISDFEVTEQMLRYFFDKINQDGFHLFTRPRVVITIPLDVTEVERKAVEDAVMNAGASEVSLISDPMAAAIGARLPVMEPVGNLIVDVGGGTTDIAVISLGGVVTWKSLGVAGDELNKNIIQYSREEFNLLIGEKVAEQIKMQLGSAAPLEEPLSVSLRGRDLLTGLPKEIMVSDSQIREAMSRSIRTIVDSVKATLENTPPELVADIYERGIVMTGGGALLRNLSALLSTEAEIPVRITDDPLTAVVRGTGIVLDNDELLELIVLPGTKED
ncbi:MAG: rod shape-determining protein [bacterium]